MTPASHPYIIRKATDEDAPAIERLAADADMGTLSPQGCTYAAVSEEGVIGFVRIVQAEGRCFVNPLVVDARTRRSGVGRALMRDARDRYGELMFVARGSAVPFYEALGATRVPLSAIARQIAADCDECSNFASCMPVPMAYR